MAAFAPGIIAIRWGTTIASVALAIDHYDGRKSVAIFAVVIVAYTRPADHPADPLPRAPSAAWSR